MASNFLFLFIATLFFAHVFAHHENTINHQNTQESRPARVDIVGAPMEIPVDDVEVQKYVKKAQEKLSAENSGDHPLIVTGVKKATRQLVAGLVYKIIFTIGTSKCRTGEETTSSCGLLENSPIRECEITVYVRSWENYEDIKITCKE